MESAAMTTSKNNMMPQIGGKTRPQAKPKHPVHYTNHSCTRRNECQGKKPIRNEKGLLENDCAFWCELYQEEVRQI